MCFSQVMLETQIENVELMTKCCPKDSCIGTAAGMKLHMIQQRRENKVYRDKQRENDK